MLNPTVNQVAILARAAKKIEKAIERIGFRPATGTQAVLRCNGRVMFTANVSMPPREEQKEYVN